MVEVHHVADISEVIEEGGGLEGAWAQTSSNMPPTSTPSSLVK